MGEFLRLIGGEIRRKHAVRRTSSPEQLAGRARRCRPLLPAGLSHVLPSPPPPFKSQADLHLSYNMQKLSSSVLAKYSLKYVADHSGGCLGNIGEVDG